MSRRTKILGSVAIGAAALIALAVVATLLVVSSAWFRETMRRKIVAETEEATGGKVTLDAFDFDVSHLRATVTNLVIHGKEPAGAAPFVRVAKAQVDLGLFSSFHQLVDIRFLGIEQPQVNVVVFPDGTTNIPSPRGTAASNQSPLATVVDLAVGHFQLSDGFIAFQQSRHELNLRGNHLRVLLTWNGLEQSYQGQLSMEPLYVVAGRNTPVTLKVTAPVVLERDRIVIQKARITTPRSNLRIDVSVTDMKNPKTVMYVNGLVALTDLKNAVNLPIDPEARNVPSTLDLDCSATIAGDSINVTSLHAIAGKSNLEASGTLRDHQGNHALAFKSTLALGEIGRLARLSFRPEGELLLNGTASLDTEDNYQADGNLQLKNLSISANGKNIQNINLVSALHADPHALDLRGLRLSALGGEFTGNAGIENLAHYRVEGNLRNLDLQQILREGVPKESLPYDGLVSGAINATGNATTADLKSLVASARLTISPGHRGIPVSGRIDANYSGANDQIALQDSYVSLPHSRLTMSGSVGKQLEVTLTSTDLNDLFAAVAAAGEKSPVVLNRGKATFAGTVTGGLTAPRISGQLAVDRFSVEGRQFDSLQADLSESQTQLAVSHGALARATMRTTFDGALGMNDWRARPNDRVTANLVLRNGDLADLMALAGEPTAGYAGSLSVDAHITGTVGNPRGSASIHAVNGVLDGEPFDQAEGRVALTDQLVTVPAADITSGSSRIDFSGDFRHPPDSFTTGRLHARVQSNQVDLAGIQLLRKREPNTAGTLQIQADLTGDLGPAFLLSALNGSASLHSLRLQGRNYGDLTATAHTSRRTLTYQADSSFSGSTIRVYGNTELTADYPTGAEAVIRNLQIAPVISSVGELTGQSGIQAQGALSGTLRFSGTMTNPSGQADLDLTRARIYDQPFDLVHTQVIYLANSIQVPQFEVVSGPSRIHLTARYDHSPADFQSGKLQFHVNSGNVNLAQIHYLQEVRSGVGGHLQISGDGSADIRAAAPRVLVTSLNANVAASGVSARGKDLGSFNLSANTTATDHLNFALQSDLGGSSIHGSGNAQLSGNYPVSADLAFQNVTWSKLQPLFATPGGQLPPFEAVVDGKLTVAGPTLNNQGRNIAQLRGSLNLSQLNVTTIPPPGSTVKAVGIRNDGDVLVTLDNGSVRLQNVKFTGPKTTIQATGTASLTSLSLNLALSANADLTLLDSFSQDIDSAGTVVVSTTIRGQVAKPLINGTLELRGARLHYATFANGISNANGTIAFNGNSVTIRNFSAETGGGSIIASGFVGYTDKIRFGLRANGKNTRILIQQGISAVTNADITLTGTTDRSLVAGTVTIDTLSYRPQSDIGSILSRAAPPVQAPSAPSPLFDNMRLDIHVRTSPALAVQASLAQNLQADADLRIRGTIAQPGVLGRVTISEGQLVFFGSTYTVNSGNIGFYNPVRIEPVLDISLETQSKGVDVVLHVTGPIDNMKLSYTSDPPLQFQEIVALLAAGRTPTSDPTLLANQPSEPQQTFEQMGESALVSKALADPVTSRLQRVFGVSQLKIDPAFTGGTQLPQARITLQQQISSNITFTYVSALNDPNTTVIRVEWAFNRQWSAVAVRDENGIFSLNFFYRKQFR